MVRKRIIESAKLPDGATAVFEFERGGVQREGFVLRNAGRVAHRIMLELLGGAAAGPRMRQGHARMNAAGNGARAGIDHATTGTTHGHHQRRHMDARCGRHGVCDRRCFGSDRRTVVA